MERNNSAIAGRLAALLLWAAALFACLRAGAAAQEELRILCGGGYGLRFSEPLNAARREAARGLAADLGMGIAFWGQEGGSVTVSGAGGISRSAQSDILFCEGEPALAFGVRCRDGRLPAAAEPNACCVSTALAQALWGAEDVCGQVLLWRDVPYTVCGVAEDESCWLLCAAPASTPAEGPLFTAIELEHPPAGDPRGAAQQIAGAAGLPYIPVPGGTLAGAAALAFRLPLALVGTLFALTLLAAAGRRLCPGARQALGFALALAFALALPALLNLLPHWLIPNRWSDFSFWRTLFALPAQTLRDLLALPPGIRDNTLQRLLLQSAAAAAGALALTVLACLRAYQKM